MELNGRLRSVADAVASGRFSSELRQSAVAASRERKGLLEKLAASSPDSLDRALLPPDVAQGLKGIPGLQVESPVSMSGVYRMFERHSPQGVLSSDQLVTATGRVLTLYSDAHLRPGTRIDVMGYLMGADVFVPSGGGDPNGSIQVRGTGSAGPSTGMVQTAVITANFADSSTSIDMGQLQQLYQGSPGNDVVDYFSEASYGKMQLAPFLFGPYRLAENAQYGCSSLDLTELMNLANGDSDYPTYSRLVFVATCTGYGASASSEGPMSTPDGTITAATVLEDAGTYTMLSTNIHELSHTLGAFNHHASMYMCLPQSFIPPTLFDQGCDAAEYGDPFDVLGGGLHHSIAQLNPYHKSLAGWLDATQFPTVTASGTYVVTPYEAPGTGIAALDIPRGASGTAFTVEYRQAAGFDSWMGSPTSCPGCTVTRGASIRLVGQYVAGGGGGSDTQLIDTTPGTIIDPTLYYPTTDVNDGALLPGKTFTDPEYGIAVTTVSAGQSGLVVQVTVPPLTCVRGTPRVTAPSPSTQTGTPGQPLTYTFSLTNADSIGCPANKFRFFPSYSYSNVQIVASPDGLTLAPGASATIALTVTPQSSATDGTYSYPLGIGRFFSDSLGNYWVTVPGATYQLTSPPDTTRPTAPTSPVARAAGSAAVSLAWGASTDNVGVIGYQILRDNAWVFVSTSTSFVDASLSPNTTHTYSIQAFDSRGNFSPAATTAVTTAAQKDFASPTPPMVQVTATDRTLTVSWTPAADNVGVAAYRISPCLVPLCGNLSPTMTSVQATGLTTQTVNSVQVTAIDGDGNVNYSRPFTVYTGPLGDAPPSQPQLLFSSSGTAEGATLNWAPSTDESGVTGYEVYRNGRPIAQVPGTSFTDPIPGPHEYYVQALDDAGGVSGLTPRTWSMSPYTGGSDTTPPAAWMTGPDSGTTVSGVVPVTASASDDRAVAKVEFYVDGDMIATSYSTPYSFQWNTTRLSNGPHWLYARAYDGAGNYGSDGGYAVVVANGDVEPPTVPADLTGTVVGSTEVDLAWSASTDDVGVTGYAVFRDGTEVADPSAPAYADTTVPAGTHTYQVLAYDGAGNRSAPSDPPVTVVVPDDPPPPPDTQPPTVPQAVTAKAVSASQVLLYWAPSTDNVGVTGYDVYRGGVVVATVPTASFTDSGLLTRKAYTYAVRARDAAGNLSAASKSVSATTLAAATTGYAAGLVTSAATGKAISGAKVSIVVNGRTTTVTTGSTGLYSLTKLPAGTYTVTVSATGFATRTFTAVIVVNLATITCVSL
jgi:chitodextrinase